MIVFRNSVQCGFLNAVNKHHCELLRLCCNHQLISGIIIHTGTTPYGEHSYGGNGEAVRATAMDNHNTLRTGDVNTRVTHQELADNIAQHFFILLWCLMTSSLLSPCCREVSYDVGGTPRGGMSTMIVFLLWHFCMQWLCISVRVSVRSVWSLQLWCQWQSTIACADTHDITTRQSASPIATHSGVRHCDRREAWDCGQGLDRTPFVDVGGSPKILAASQKNKQKF